MPTFYLAILISFSITLLLVYLIHRITVWLDKRHDWRDNFKERLFWQFSFGVLFPSLLDLGLVSFHSFAVGIDFSENPFLLYDFPIIVLFFILLNMYYYNRFLVLTDSRKKKSSDSDEKLIVSYGGVYAELNLEKEVICFYRDVQLIKIVTINRQYNTRGESITDLEVLYSEKGFLRISRSTVINMRFVQGYSPGEKRDTVKVNLNSEINQDAVDTDALIVTDKYLSEFKSRFTGKS